MNLDPLSDTEAPAADFELACGVVAVNRVASETLRGAVLIGIAGDLF